MARRYLDLADAVKFIGDADASVQDYVRTIVAGDQAERKNIDMGLQMRFKDQELPGSVIVIEDRPNEVGNTTNEVEYEIPVTIYTIVKHRVLKTSRTMIGDAVNAWEVLLNKQIGGTSANYNGFGVDAITTGFARTEIQESEDGRYYYQIAKTDAIVGAIFDIS